MSPRASSAALAVALLSLLLTGCVRVRWTQENRFEPIDPEEHAWLEPGESDLGDALGHLGAPLFVWEQTSETFAIAYGWYNGRAAGGTVSVPITDYNSASFSYDALAARLYGLVLTFDRDERLTIVREGYLRDIAPELLTKRPSFSPEWVKDETAR